MVTLVSRLDPPPGFVVRALAELGAVTVMDLRK